MPSNSDYRKTKPREERKVEATHIKTKYPDRIPIVLERSKTCTIEEDDNPKKKWLVPNKMTIEQFMKTIRKRNKFVKVTVKNEDGEDEEQEQKLYLFINNVIIDTEASLSYLYDKNLHKDGYLYIKYSNHYDYGKKTSTLLNSLNPWGTAAAERKRSEDISTSELEIEDISEETN